MRDREDGRMTNEGQEGQSKEEWATKRMGG
jgi:hypothetical protein